MPWFEELVSCFPWFRSEVLKVARWRRGPVLGTKAGLANESVSFDDLSFLSWTH